MFEDVALSDLRLRELSTVGIQTATLRGPYRGTPGMPSVLVRRSYVHVDLEATFDSTASKGLARITSTVDTNVAVRGWHSHWHSRDISCPYRFSKRAKRVQFSAAQSTW